MKLKIKREDSVIDKTIKAMTKDENLIHQIIQSTEDVIKKVMDDANVQATVEVEDGKLAFSVIAQDIKKIDIGTIIPDANGKTFKAKNLTFNIEKEIKRRFQ